jgi:hypothetical protein
MALQAVAGKSGVRLFSSKCTEGCGCESSKLRDLFAGKPGFLKTYVKAGCSQLKSVEAGRLLYFNHDTCLAAKIAREILPSIHSEHVQFERLDVNRAHSHFLGRKKIHHRDTENKEIAQR